MKESQTSWDGGRETVLALDKQKGPSGWAPGVIAPPHPEPDVARAVDSEQEVVLGARLGQQCKSSRGRCCRCSGGHRRE